MATTKTDQQSTMKQKMSDILVAVSWREIAHTYFGKSSSWLYHKMEGNGSKDEFSDEEAVKLKGALNDLADRIRRCADNI